MKKLLFCLVVVVALVVGVVLTACGEPEQEKYFEWTLSEVRPPGSTTSMPYEFWAAEMERRTEGHFKVNISWGGELAGMTEAAPLCGQGVFEMCGYSPFVSPGQTPLYPMASLPLLAPDKDQDRTHLCQYIVTHPAVQEEAINAFNIVPILAYYTTPFVLYTNTKIEKYEDFKGLRIFSDPADAPMYVGMGLTPVTSGDYYAQYEMMQKGMIDIAAMSTTSGKSVNLNEVTKYIMTTYFWYGSVPIAVNKDAWEELPQYIRDISDEILRDDMPAKCEEVFGPALEEYLAYFKEVGMEIIEPSADMRAKCMDAAKGSWQTKIEAIEGQGFPVREFLRDVIAYREQLTGESWTGYQP